MNNLPLEKQLLQINLSKGLNERDRPESADPATCLTRVENLVQDQSGAWVHRNGTTQLLTSDTSGTGTYPASVIKALAFVKGWGVIADGGKVLHKQDYVDKFRTRQALMDWSATEAAFVGSSGPQAESATLGSTVYCVASCTTHDAFVIRGLTTFPYVQSDRLVISERATGTEYVYDLTSLYSGKYRCLTFCTDRYLHLYYDASVIVIDVQSAMPASVANLTPVVLAVYAGTAATRDAVGGVNFGFVTIYDVSGLSFNIYKTNPATGALLGTYSGGGAGPSQLAIDEINNLLWTATAGGTMTVRKINMTTMVDFMADTTTGVAGTYIAIRPGNNNFLIVYQTTTTIGTTSCDTLVVRTANFSNGPVAAIRGGMYGWTPVSTPFYVTSNGKYYMHMVKHDPTSTLSSHAIVDLSTFTGFYSNTAGLSLPYGSFRVACHLEPFVGMRLTGVAGGTVGVTPTGITCAYRYQCQGGYEFSACVPYQTAARVSAVGFTRLRLADATALGCANFSGSTYIAHGGLNQYDGTSAFEQGFADMPMVGFVTPTVTVGLLDGAYRYYAVYRHVDSNGASSYSRTYGPIATTNVAASTGKNNITVQPYGLTNRDSGLGDSSPIVELYRTKNAGTQFYLCASSAQNAVSPIQQLAVSATTGLLTVVDNMSDASLITQAAMHRQPGTPNSAADRYSSPASKIVVQHKDRIFCADPYGQRVYYSSFFVDGENAWFNPAFNFFVHDGQGPITALASMDGRLFVFKRNQIFVVDGDGPSEAGPVGNEFSPPMALATRFGCVDHRSVVVTPDGIMYRSSRGFELLTRSLQVKWVGERVWQSSEPYPVTTGSCMDFDGRVRWTVAASEGVTGSPTIAGAELVYDLGTDAWSKNFYTGSAGVYGRCKQGVAVVTDDGEDKLVYCDPDGRVQLSDATVGTDGGVYAPWVIETAWIKVGLQTRQRINNVMFLAKKRTAANHAIKISAAYNYIDSYTQTHTFEPGVINATAIEELCLQMVSPQTLAVRFKIEEIQPASIAVTSSTFTTPIVVTAAAHGFVDGDTIVVAGHATNTAANGTWVVSGATTNTFVLVGTVGIAAGTGGTATYPVGTGLGCEVLGIAVEVAPIVGTPKLAAGQKA